MVPHADLERLLKSCRVKPTAVLDADESIRPGNESKAATSLSSRGAADAVP
jgi:hypothetical protein